MQISEPEVRRIAKLARLGLTDQEVKKFSAQLSGILDHAKMLQEVDTEGVEPAAQITGLQNVIYPDVIRGCDYSEKLISQTPQNVQENMIKVKSVF